MQFRPFSRSPRAASWHAALPVCALLLVPGLAAAQELSAEAITEAVSDKTYQGSMTADAFAEYYASDGTIKGDGYTGQWRAEDDMLCFQYGDDPEACWGVFIDGPAMTLLKDGKPDGSGMLVDGNPLEL